MLAEGQPGLSEASTEVQEAQSGAGRLVFLRELMVAACALSLELHTPENSMPYPWCLKPNYKTLKAKVE